MIISGEHLNRSIIVERATSVANAFNEPVQSWAPLMTARAQRIDVSDGEKFAAGQIGSSLRSRFVIRSSAAARGITPSDRLSHEGSSWSIHGVKELKEAPKHFIEITAVKDAD